MDIEAANWSEFASLNTVSPPNAFRPGMIPDDENATFREVMAAVKREWNRSHPTVTMTGTNIWALSLGVAPTEYVHGQIFAGFLPTFALTSNKPSLDVNSLGRRHVFIITHSGVTQPFGASFGFGGMPVFFYYDSTLDSGTGGFVVFSMLATPVALENIECPITSETGAVATGTGKFTFRMPYSFVVSDVRASLNVAQTSGSILTIDVNASGSSIFSTNLTIDNGEKTSATAVTPFVFVNAAAPATPETILDDTEITIDVDQIGDGTAKGLKVCLLGFAT